MFAEKNLMRWQLMPEVDVVVSSVTNAWCFSASLPFLSAWPTTELMYFHITAQTLTVALNVSAATLTQPLSPKICTIHSGGKITVIVGCYQRWGTIWKGPSRRKGTLRTTDLEIMSSMFYSFCDGHLQPLWRDPLLTLDSLLGYSLDNFWTQTSLSLPGIQTIWISCLQLLY